MCSVSSLTALTVNLTVLFLQFKLYDVLRYLDMLLEIPVQQDVGLLSPNFSFILSYN
jgi:hypothetical protein